MAESILKIHTQNGDIPVGYPGLADKPIADKTLSEEGAFADSKAVGDKFKEVKTETDSLKEDLGNLSSSKISKFYATNNGENHLADSDDGKIADMMVYGKSEQKQYSGTNYAELVKTSVEGVEVVDRLTGTVKVLGQGTLRKVTEEIPAGTYTISYTLTPGDSIWVMVIRDSETKVLDTLIDSATTLKKTFTANAPFSLHIGANSNTETYITINNLTFNKGNKALPFEPYTGGAPSPSPDYPQEIRSVVKPTLKVVGKNLVKSYRNDKTSKPYSAVAYAEIDDIVPNTKYTLSMVIANGNKVYVNEGLASFIQIVGDGTRKQVTITTRSNLSREDYEQYTKGKGWILLKNDANNTVVSDTQDIQLELGTIPTSYEPYHEQTVTLPYTLNAIPVSSGGNVTIGGRQYIADYVDVERGKLVRMVGITDQDTFFTSKWDTGSIVIYSQLSNVGTKNAIVTISSKFKADWSAGDEIHHFTQPTGQTLVIVLPKTITTVEQGEEIRAKGFKFYYILVTPIEIDLTEEEITAFKALATYYPVTNISVNSEQLDGYTVFNYPISMANGWNYVKQQLNDNRDYIYDMDTQSAEAYVNSEYAVALTELEV